MNMPRKAPVSQLFSVRLWREELDEGRTEMRGKVQHVLSGEAYYFRDWATLITLLIQMTGETVLPTSPLSKPIEPE